MSVLTVVFYGLVLAGVAAGLAGLMAPSVRSRMFLAAAASFGLAGVLGILSIGVVFIAASIVCVLAAVRSRETARSPR